MSIFYFLWIKFSCHFRMSAAALRVLFILADKKFEVLPCTQIYHN